MGGIIAIMDLDTIFTQQSSNRVDKNISTALLSAVQTSLDTRNVFLIMKSHVDHETFLAFGCSGLHESITPSQWIFHY